MAPVIEIERQGAIALVAINNPPVNAASAAVRQGLHKAIAALDADKSVAVIAVYGQGRTFVAGADIREFGKPPQEPHLPDLCNSIEDCTTPVIAVLHGTPLGGGLEIGLGAHARIGITGVRVGLPEVNIGVMPGAGGTQRVPRLIGMDAALEMITTGRHIPDNEALNLGLLDRLTDGQPRDIAIASAQEVLDGTLATRRVGQIEVTRDDPTIERWRDRMATKHPHLISPQKCVDAVAASVLPIKEGVRAERRLFMDCLNSPQRAGLIHAFFSERAVAKVPEAGATPRDVNAIGVIGGGTMGSGIATSALLAGLDVTLIEVDQPSLDRAVATIATNLDGAVKRNKFSDAARNAALNEQLKTSTDYAALATADVIIEAAFEDMAVKSEIFAKVDAVAKPGAILATNTSYLDINDIAAATTRADDVIGLHFFSPAHIMHLLEVVVADKTKPDVVATGFALAKKLKKLAVRAGVCDGFIGNRILTHYRKAADYMLIDGAAPEQIDAALEKFGFAMGPFAVSDLAGLDIGWAARKRRSANRPQTERYIAIADRICENGWFGRKTGQGYYLYDGKERRPNPAVAEIIDAERNAAGIDRRAFTDQDIIDRYLTAMISEAAQVVDDGVALRPIDVDAVLLNGYGFPRFRGGPMFVADTIGAGKLIERIQNFAREDEYFWRVPPLLERMARDGATFADLNKDG